MKKVLFLLAMTLTCVVAKAQFGEGKVYLGASLTGLDMNYNGKNGFNIGLEAKAGYFFTDNWMLLSKVSLDHNGSETVSDRLSAGLGLRYYIVQNGLYLGLTGKFLHADHNYNDVMPGMELGYAFFLNRSVTLEPAAYYDHSFRKSDCSTVGFKIGVGIYLCDA